MLHIIAASSLPSPPASSPRSPSHPSPESADALSQLPTGSESSKLSQESRDCVEQQLTQSLEIGLESSDEDTGEDDSDVPIQQSPTHARISTSPPSIFPSSVTSSAPAGQGQQSWYNQNPAALLQPAKSDKALNSDGSRPGSFVRMDSEVSLSSKGGQSIRHVPPMNMFRSGTLQINPVAPQLVPSDSRRYAAPQVVNNVLLHHHHQENHTSSRTTWTAYSAPRDSQASAQLSRSISPSSQEFDMLQTQAPYRSQSWGI